MELNQVIDRAMEIRELYAQLQIAYCGTSWSGAQVAAGFIGDVGDLMKLIFAKDGVREIPNADKEFEHELADCLWSIIVLAKTYNVDLEQAFSRTMDELEVKVAKKLSGQ